MLLISLIAFSATSRGWILGFSGSVFRNTIEGNGSSGSAASVFGDGGATYNSFNGGSSSISEKLTPRLPAPASSAISGSTAIFGFCVVGSSATAADMFAMGFSSASTEALTTDDTYCDAGSAGPVLGDVADASAFDPAAAAAAFTAGGFSLDFVVTAGVQEVSSSSESEELVSTLRASKAFDSVRGATGDCAAANFVAAAAFTLSGTTSPLGASAGDFFTVLPEFSRHFSRSLTISRPLW